MCSFGSSNNSAPTTQFSTQTTTAAPQAQAMYNQAWQNAQKVSQRPFQPYSYDPNAFVAPMNQTQMQAVGNIGSYQGASDPFFQMGANMVGQAGNTAAPSVLNQYTNPYMNQVVDPVRAAVQQQQAMQNQQLIGDQVKAGAFGQERGQLMRAVQAGQQNLGLGQALSPLYQDAYKTGLGAAQADLTRQMQAGQTMGQLGQGYTQTGLGAAQALLGAGTVGQQTQQAGLQALYNQYLMQQQYPFQQAQFLSSIAAGLGPGFGGTTSGFQSSLAPLSSMGMPLSDPSAKVGAEGEEPEVIGSTHDGQDIYRYRVVDPETGEIGPVQIGLMADEVEQRRPDAIGEYKNTGLRTVDYEKATDGAARMGGGVRPEGGDYAYGGGVDDIVNSHQAMYAPLAQMGARGIIPESKMVTANLTPAQLSYMSPQQKQQYTIGNALKDAVQVYSLGKGVKGEYDEWRAGKDKEILARNPSEYNPGYPRRASGGSITGYDDDQADVEMRHGPDKTNMPTAKLDTPTLSYAKPQKQDEGGGLDDALKIGKTVFDIGSKLLPMLSDPRVKTGVRPARADGGGVLDDFINAISGHGYIDGSSWEDAPAAAGEPMDIRPRSAGLRPAARPATPPAARHSVMPRAAREEPREISFHPNDDRSLGAGILPSSRFTPFPHGDRREIAFNPPPYGLGDEPRPAHFVDYDRDIGVDHPSDYEMAKMREITEDNRPLGVGVLGFAKGGAADDEDSLFERLLARESGGKQFDRKGRPLTSSTGALGIAQIMPGTMPEAARYAGLEPDMERLRNDPEYGKALGKAYLKHQIDTFGGDEAKGVAAYNAGAGGVSRAIRKAEAAGGDWRDFLPEETKSYLPGVMGGKGLAPLAYSASSERPRSAPLDAIDAATGGKGVVPAAGGDETPARGLTGFFRGTPARDMGEKAGDFLTSERFIVPLLSGLGAMASSQSRYLAPAILQGLGAGAASYMEVPKIEAETERTRQEALNKVPLTKKFEAEAEKAKSELYEKQWIPNVGWMVYDKTKPYSAPIRISDVTGKPLPGSENYGGVPPAPSGSAEKTAPTPADAAVGAALGKGEKQPERKAAVIGDAANWQPTVEAPDGIEIPGAMNAAMTGDIKNQQSSAQAIIDKQAEVAKGAYDQQYRLDEMEKQFATLEKDGGFLSPGSGSDLRVDIAKTANTLSRIIGGNPIFDPNDVAAAENLAKDATRLGFATANTLGHEPGFIVSQAVKANPSMENSPLAFKRIVAGLREATKYEQDRLQFMESYRNKYSTLSGADALFRKLNPPEAYAKRAVLSTLDAEDIKALRGLKRDDIKKLRGRIDKKYGDGVTGMLLGEN